jgi:hypothetical protein
MIGPVEMIALSESTMQDAAVAIKALNLDLTQEEKDILYEFTRAREVMFTLSTPGWLHIQDLALSKIDRIQAKFLEMKNITPEALWAMHIAQQYVSDFWNSMASQLATTGDWLKDPEAVQAMLSRVSKPQEEDLEGELERPEAEPMPRFPEDKA